jgi:hypothetical protein
MWLAKAFRLLLHSYAKYERTKNEFRVLWSYDYVSDNSRLGLLDEQGTSPRTAKSRACL